MKSVFVDVDAALRSMNMPLREVLLSSPKSSFFKLGFVPASAGLFGALDVITKQKLCVKYSVRADDSDTPAKLPNRDANVLAEAKPQRSYEVVVAATPNMGIGKDGKLPWRLPSDLKFFKELTMTTSDPGKKNAVVMGRKTWECIPLKHRPLPGRLNVVLTHSRSFGITSAESVVKCGSMPSALELLAESPYCLSIEKVFVIGGGQVLGDEPLNREALNAPGCNAIHITEIETSIECDTFIPRINSSVFQRWYSSSPLVENNIRYRFVTYVRVV